MSQQHQQHLVDLRLLDSHESVDDAINYRIQVLQAFGPEHELFARGCVDLLNMLIDTNTLSKAMRAIQDDLSRRGGDASSIEKVNACFSKALTTVLARAGLVATGAASSNHLSSLNPRAPPYAAASPVCKAASSASKAATASGYTTSTTVPALSPTNTSPDKPSSGVATPMPTGRTIAAAWGRKNIRLSRIPQGMDLHHITMGVDKYSGNMISYSPRTGEAIVSFPVVTAQDMLRQESVVVGDHVCSADDKIAPLAENVVKPSSNDPWAWGEMPKKTQQTNGQDINGVKQQLEDLAISASKKELEDTRTSTKSNATELTWDDVPLQTEQEQIDAFKAATTKPDSPIDDTFAQPVGTTNDEAFHADQTNKTESAMPISPSPTAEVSSSLDNISFANWKKGFNFKKPDTSKYRREQPAAELEQATEGIAEEADNTFGGNTWEPDTAAFGGWDGAASPTYLIERGLMAPLPDIEDAGPTFSITGTFPFNTNGVANGLSSRFGNNALALYQVPIEHEKFRGFIFDKTVTYYAKFRELCAPAHEPQEICLESRSGEGGRGWYVKLEPVEDVGANAYIVRDQPSLVGYVDY